MQLYSRARVSSKALEGLLKVTRYKLCKCSRFLAKLTSVFIYQLITTFIMCLSDQCAYSKKVKPLRGHLLGFAHLLFNCATKNFLILRSNYTAEVFLMLHEWFVSKTGPKCNCLIDFSPPICQPRVHIRKHIVVYC